MTGLERLWDDYPVDPPPTADIVREGRRSTAARGRRFLIRPLLAGGAAAALGLAFIAGTQVGSMPGAGTAASDAENGGAGGDLGAGPGFSDASPVAFVQGLHAPSSCADLLASYKDRAMPLVSAYGWNGGYGGPVPLGGREMYSMPQAAADSAASTASGGAPANDLGSVTSSDTGTNVQEAGVDEPDTVKTDGKLLVRVKGRHLLTYDVTGSKPEEVSDLRLPELDGGQVLLRGTDVVVLGVDTASFKTASGAPSTTMLTVSLADPATPVITHTVRFSSGVVDARQYGDVVRLVLSAGLPQLDFVQPGGSVGQNTALKRNRALVEKSTINDWLPSYDDGSGEQPLLDCDQVALPDDVDEVGLDTVSLTGFTMSDPTDFSSVAIAAPTTLTYSTPDRLYLADSGYGSPMACAACDMAVAPGGWGSDGVTHVYAFALQGAGAEHIASGSADGFLANRWAMDSVGDSLRLALSASGATRNASSIVTMGVEGDELTTVGQLGDIAPGEQIKSVRWFDDVVLLVTFLETDPLFAIDLTDPAHPTTLSALKIPGFSTYLHPVGKDRILGVGQSGDHDRTKVSLFDASDLKAVREVSVARFGAGTYPIVGDEPKAFTWLPDRDTALTVLSGADGRIYIGVARITPDQRLQLSSIKVAEGYDAYAVRTVELPDHRVVLVTPDTVSLLDL